MSVRIVRPATVLDAESIAAIYNPYIAETIVTFETEPVSASEIAGRIERVTATHPWLVCVSAQGVCGYAYAAPWHSRCAYRLTTETTVYVDASRRGRGIGAELYGALLDGLRAARFHCAIAGIALPNAASVALHERFGFSKAGHFKEVGRKFDRWIDVGYWELTL